MGKRNPANKGQGKVITAAFTQVQHNGASLPVVLLASSKKGAIVTQLYGVMQVSGLPNGAPAFVLVTNITGIGASTHGLALAKAQASYNGHPRRAPAAAASWFGLAPAPVKPAKAGSAASAAQGA